MAGRPYDPLVPITPLWSERRSSSVAAGQLRTVRVCVGLQAGMTVSTTMLPHYDSPLPTLYEPQPQPPKPRLMFKMPRVVPDQKSKFESDELFRRLARETEQVRYTGYRDRPMEERRQRFQAGVREGHTEVGQSCTKEGLCKPRGVVARLGCVCFVRPGSFPWKGSWGVPRSRPLGEEGAGCVLSAGVGESLGS
ncbi:putative protein big brother-like [Penaeus vannamei]|uniref:Protein big brother n=1 Tax=Penaeus vannamei TaxID=6689 RepID=A0A423SR48_PENVA|nr:putative protein big brother-like [Penaeus vannamei]